MANLGSRLVDTAMFVDLQEKIDDDSKVRDQIRDITQILEKEVKLVLSTLTNAHSYTAGDIEAQINENALSPMIEQISSLAQAMAGHPYYKFNALWQQQMQDASFAIILYGWLGGFGRKVEGQLLTLEEVGSKMNVPVNLKDTDAFHLTIEEYLQALISLIEELARFARNSVIIGNYQRPLLISQFIKDLHAGFQLLNLKNNNLRRRSDGIKYRLREVEDIVYDLSLRNLLTKAVA